METTSNQLVHVRKEFPVSVDELYNAWNNPDELKQWWSPMGHKLKEVKNDLTQGGQLEYRFGNDQNATTLIINGDYEEVKDKERLVYSWNWHYTQKPIEDSPYKLTITFSATGNGSILDVKQENLKDDEAIKVHQEGWEKALSELYHHLST